MNKIIITIGTTLTLIGCSPKVTQDLYWVDQYGGLVPIIVTQIEDTTTIEWKPDTINDIRH
jgi:hypothetical protein